MEDAEDGDLQYEVFKAAVAEMAFEGKRMDGRGLEDVRPLQVSQESSSLDY